MQVKVKVPVPPFARKSSVRVGDADARSVFQDISGKVRSLARENNLTQRELDKIQKTTL
jgi:hypothetical protein